ncbi:glycosyltransferase family 9 protein [Nonlabens ulvanivorans]|uniref:ADP-heptose--LPS heptosyltransferase n=2 Tax=Nonlabens ulvanivorans TaxID=906888 RepID=A0A084JY50_NONUL|nr:glycosyltransferase family 9 protein [Nonlabens ulvanivorans]KEZ93884.1 ADP-heptose--LPS heptosyltransferase [Nonlabens ulvanivorans]
MNILLIQYKMIGDVLTSTIIAEQLKIIYPDAQIHYLISKTALAVVEGNTAIDKFICVDNKEFDSWRGVFTLARKLKKNNYSISIDAYGKNNSALLSRIVGAVQRIGYKKWFAPWVYTTAIKNSPDSAIYKTGLSLGSRLLLTTSLTQNVQWDLLPKIHLSESEKQEGKKWLLENGLDLNSPITMVSALGSSMNKTLPLIYMAQVVDLTVQESGSQVLFNYLPSQKDQAFEIYNACLPETQKHIFINAITPSLRDYLKVLHHCTTVIGNEGGAINMGKALDIPSFAIFSPWINKRSWNAGEDGKKHISVHLKDVKAELYGTKKASAFKKQAQELYQHFKPELMFENLKKFVDGNY